MKIAILDFKDNTEVRKFSFIHPVKDTDVLTELFNMNIGAEKAKIITISQRSVSYKADFIERFFQGHVETKKLNAKLKKLQEDAGALGFDLVRQKD